MNKKLVIFDLDGTLIDSLKDIAFSTNRVLIELGFEEHPIEEYKRFIGDGAKELVKRALPDSSDEEKVLEALEIFKKEYGGKETIHTKPFDGGYQMLHQLQDSCEFALLSNKPHEFTLKYMEQFFKEFGTCFGCDSSFGFYSEHVRETFLAGIGYEQ